QALLVERAARGLRARVRGVAPLLQAGGHTALGRRRAARSAALVAGPAEVGALAGVDLLPGVPADVADVDLVGDGVDGEAERIPQAEGVDLGAVTRGAGRVVEGVVRQAARREGVDAQDLAREAVHVLRAQRARVDLGVVRAVAVADEQRAVVAEHD